ncbi:MAG: hypothetical protein IKB86_05975 [Clostridia bacterium]|nr:hypothetical protein [Clostridia bacterium]
MKKRRVVLALIGVACFCILIFLSVGTQYGEWLDNSNGWQQKYLSFSQMLFERNAGKFLIYAFLSVLPLLVSEIFFRIRKS